MRVRLRIANKLMLSHPPPCSFAIDLHDYAYLMSPRDSYSLCDQLENHRPRRHAENHRPRVMSPKMYLREKRE